MKKSTDEEACYLADNKKQCSFGGSRLYMKNILQAHRGDSNESACRMDAAAAPFENKREIRAPPVPDRLWHGGCCTEDERTCASRHMNESANILVVDDEAVVRASHLRTLTDAHCNVEAVWNGYEALDVMERHPFDVVLLDLRMPGMDGMSVLKTMKERWPESEVIIITGYPSVETAKEAARLGAYDYLVKPVGPDDVINAAHGAMLQKKWALHRDRTAKDERSVSSTGSRGTHSSPAY